MFWYKCIFAYICHSVLLCIEPRLHFGFQGSWKALAAATKSLTLLMLLLFAAQWNRRDPNHFFWSLNRCYFVWCKFSWKHPVPLSVAHGAVTNIHIILQRYSTDSWWKLIATLAINKIQSEGGIIFSCKSKPVALFIILNRIIFEDLIFEVRTFHRMF